jgi:hypothetical protein
MTKMFFDTRVSCRMREDEIKLIKRVIKHNRDLYDNESHFIRCAVLRELRCYNDRLPIKARTVNKV